MTQSAFVMSLGIKDRLRGKGRNCERNVTTYTLRVGSGTWEFLDVMRRTKLTIQDMWRIKNLKFYSNTFIDITNIYLSIVRVIKIILNACNSICICHALPRDAILMSGSAQRTWDAIKVNVTHLPSISLSCSAYLFYKRNDTLYKYIIRISSAGILIVVIKKLKSLR